GYVEAAESAQVSNQAPSIKHLVDESPKPHPWIATAREIGEKWMEEQELKTDKRPSVVRIAQYVEGELARREIRGPQGKFLLWETIKKDALKGITGRRKNGGGRYITGAPNKKPLPRPEALNLLVFLFKKIPSGGISPPLT
ncbi:MAG: hypothetical protein Q8S55_00005, partial [Methylococcaceae bacterium]|nr:hypothetical protein [Methylococcaceae bacterium]